MEFSYEPRYKKKKDVKIWREIRLSKDEDKKWHEQPMFERSWMAVSAVLS